MSNPAPRIIKWPTEEEAKRAFQEYVLAVGKVSYAWNHLHERLGRLFSAVIGAEQSVALAIWYAVSTDSGQRRLLSAAIKALEWPSRPKAAADLKWLLDQVDGLSEHRNNAIHTPTSLNVSVVTQMGVAFWGSNPRAKKLIGRQLLAEFAWCEQCTELLLVFCDDLFDALTFQDDSWPARPVLPESVNLAQKERKTRPRKIVQ